MHMTITDDFSALGLSEQMLAAVRAKGFETPTAIQKLTIPHLLTKPNDIGSNCCTKGYKDSHENIL